MAQIIVCDRCRKEISGKPKFIDLKPAHYILGIETTNFDYWEGEVTYRCEYQFCNACARELGRFLHGEGRDVKEE